MVRKERKDGPVTKDFRDYRGFLEPVAYRCKVLKVWRVTPACLEIKVLVEHRVHQGRKDLSVSR